MADADFEQLDALYDFMNRGVLTRIDERGERCGDLYQWALHPRKPEAGSALATDDEAFAVEYPKLIPGSQAVTEHALFPVMRAVESLHTAGILISRRRSHRQPHIGEVLQLCRVAAECASLALWLLGDASRRVRLDNCISEEMEQLKQQGYFLAIGDEHEANHSERYPQRLLRQNADHRRKFKTLVEDAKSAYGYAKPPKFTLMTRQSARWVDVHVPPHDSGEIGAHGLENKARSLYSFGSSFIHGYKWSAGYGRNGDVWKMVADSLVVALNMTECAACLLEAALRAPRAARPANSLLPARFEPTVAAWSAEFFSE